MSADEPKPADQTTAEDESGAVFEPVIKLEDKVEVKTHEEDENVLFKMSVALSRPSPRVPRPRPLGSTWIVPLATHRTRLSQAHNTTARTRSRRAKLFRFFADTNEWKERGTGDLRLLEHKGSKKIRLVMRRDKTLKVCANHYGQLRLASIHATVTC